MGNFCASTSFPSHLLGTWVSDVQYPWCTPCQRSQCPAACSARNAYIADLILSSESSITTATTTAPRSSATKRCSNVCRHRWLRLFLYGHGFSCDHCTHVRFFSIQIRWLRICSTSAHSRPRDLTTTIPTTMAVTETHMQDSFKECSSWQGSPSILMLMSPNKNNIE